jgi:predicted  nucleic acid-binding Zn-ribbon protein
MVQKKITIEYLARMVKDGFEKAEKRTDEKIDGLAVMVQKGFQDVDNRFDAVEKRLDDVEKRLVRLESGFENLRVEVREIKYLLSQKASREELNDLDMRLAKVEMRMKKAGV